MLTQHHFHNALRVLRNIDPDEVPFLDQGRWLKFEADPVSFFIRADQETADAIWAVVERRCGLSQRIAA